MQRLKDTAILQKRELELTSGKPYVPRAATLPHLEKSPIKVIIGPRRSGKSFFVIHQLKNKSVGYINFDDEYLVRNDDYSQFIDVIKTVYHDPSILFFDEIQNLANWELFVNRLQRQGYNLIITGSNSNLLSRELATHLTGRHLPTVLFPFSFAEYLQTRGTDLTQGEIQAAFSEYLQNGGYPEPLVNKIEYKRYLKPLYDSILLKDIVTRHRIKSAHALENLSDYLIANAGTLLSYNTLTKTTDIKSVHTIEKYLKYLEEAFLFFQVKRFSYKVKEQLKAPKKIYVIDNGFITHKSFTISPNYGKLYENLVAVELKKRDISHELEFYYYKTQQNHEVDFVVKKGRKIESLIQVCSDLARPDTEKRETHALLHASKELRCKKLLVLTGAVEKRKTITWHGIKREIRFIPLWKWLPSFGRIRMKD